MSHTWSASGVYLYTPLTLLLHPFQRLHQNSMYTPPATTLSPRVWERPFHDYQKQVKYFSFPQIGEFISIWFPGHFSGTLHASLAIAIPLQVIKVGKVGYTISNSSTRTRRCISKSFCGHCLEVSGPVDGFPLNVS